MGDVIVSGLWVYPIKSFGGIELGESAVEPRGLRHDRRWMLVDADGVFLTQRSDTRLALYRTGFAECGLTIKSPWGEERTAPFEPAGSRRTVQVWKSTCEAIQVSRDLDEWFSDHLHQPCSLVYMPDDTKRETNPEYTRQGDIVGFADAFPVLVIGESSLFDLNGRLESAVPMNRFRPNIVVSGTLPHAEDDWSSLVIGDLKFRYAKNCGRCSVTATDQETGEVGVEPLRTLASYRRREQSVQFGAYFVPGSLGQIRVGDKVRSDGD